MFKKFINKEAIIAWIKATAIRVLRTMGQVAASYLTIGLAIRDVDWLGMLSVMAVAGLYSIVTNLVSTPPESADDGEVIIDPEGESIGNLVIFTKQDELMDKKKLVLNIKHDTLPTPEDSEDYKDE